MFICIGYWLPDWRWSLAGLAGSCRLQSVLREHTQPDRHTGREGKRERNAAEEGRNSELCRVSCLSERAVLYTVYCMCVSRWLTGLHWTFCVSLLFTAAGPSVDEELTQRLTELRSFWSVLH